MREPVLTLPLLKPSPFYGFAMRIMTKQASGRRRKMSLQTFRGVNPMVSVGPVYSRYPIDKVHWHLRACVIYGFETCAMSVCLKAVLHSSARASGPMAWRLFLCPCDWFCIYVSFGRDYTHPTHFYTRRLQKTPDARASTLVCDGWPSCQSDLRICGCVSRSIRLSSKLN